LGIAIGSEQLPVSAALLLAPNQGRLALWSHRKRGAAKVFEALGKRNRLRITAGGADAADLEALADGVARLLVLRR